MFLDSYGAPSKAPLMEKFKKDLNSATFMYQGKTLLTQPTPALKKNNVTLKSFQGTKASKNALDAARKGHQSGQFRERGRRGDSLKEECPLHSITLMHMESWMESLG